MNCVTLLDNLESVKRNFIQFNACTCGRSVVSLSVVLAVTGNVAISVTRI